MSLESRVASFPLLYPEALDCLTRATCTRDEAGQWRRTDPMCLVIKEKRRSSTLDGMAIRWLALAFASLNPDGPEEGAAVWLVQRLAARLTDDGFVVSSP